MRRKNQRGTPGVINIMVSPYHHRSFIQSLITILQSHVNNAQPGKKIASLYLETEKQNEQYVLSASERDSTEVYLVPTVPPAGGSLTAHRRDNFKQEMLVSLRVQIENQEYCATYDPNPPEAEPLTMQPCMTVADESDDEQRAKDVEAGKDRDPDNHKSQTFSFDPDSGVIRPMWFAGEHDGKTDSAHAEDVPEDATSSSVSSTSPSSTAAGPEESLSSVVSSAAAAEDTSTPTSAVLSPSSRSASAPSPTPTSTITTRDASSAQNVTLVFVPSSKPSAAAANAVDDAPQSSILASVPLPSASSAPGDNDTTSASPSQTASAASDDSEATSTLTKTVTVTASAGPTDSSSPTPTATTNAAAKDTSDDGASSTTTITISASALPSPTASKGGEAGSLSVQVVGDDGKTVGDDDPNTSNPPMDQDSSSASSASATPASSSSAGSAAPTPPGPPSPPVPAITSAPIPSLPVNPMAVASDVAQSWSASQSASSAAASTSAASASDTASTSQPSATASQTAPDALKSEVVAVKSSRMINSRIARRQPMMTPVSTAPYKWLFKFGGI